MNQDVDRDTSAQSIAPLRKRRPGGELYHRRTGIEEQLIALLRLSPRELVERARISDQSNADYVPSECVLYFVRRPNFGSDKDALGELFLVLRDRVRRAVRVARRPIAGTGKQGENSVDVSIRDVVTDKFQEMLCRDRVEYEENLDFYECRFNYALSLLRATARRDVRKEAARFEPMDSGGDSGEPSAKIEAALASLRPPFSSDGDDFLYRSKLLAAINSLPHDQRRVVELLLLEVPIESEDGEAETIVKILGCVEKTVRNRRDRAFATIRDVLKEEEEA